MTQLPPWPNEKPEHLGFANSGYWERYERARAEAAMARLRLAVEELQRTAANDKLVAVPGSTKRRAIDVLAMIGQLPPAEGA